MKNINSIISVIILTLILNGCNEHKQAVKKLFKETHEKELVLMLEEFEKNANKITSCNKFENGVYLGRSDEWNEKIKPLMDKITEHHKQYHENNYIFTDKDTYNEWICFGYNSVVDKFRERYFTKCPFCNDMMLTSTGLPKTFEETSMYKTALLKKIVKEDLENLNEQEFVDRMKILEKLVDEDNSFTVADDLSHILWTKDFKENYSQLLDLHLKYHQFSDEFKKEFMTYYFEESISAKENNWYKEQEDGTPIIAPIFCSDYTCCPWCRLLADCEKSQNEKKFSYDSYNLLDMGFWNEWGMNNKWNIARNNKEKEMREVGEKEALKYLNPFTSYFERGKLGVEIKNSRDCPSVLFIPAYIEGIEVGEVYIQGVDSLKEVWLPKTAKRVSFPHCYNLEKVHLNEGLKTIAFGGFVCCYKLQSITIPDSVETIADDAFLNCVSLEEVNLPKSLTSLGSNFLGFNFGNTSYVHNFNDGWDERFKRYKYKTGYEQPIKRKTLNIVIPDEMKKNIVFNNERYSSGKIWNYTFSGTADYLSLATQAKIRNLGYNGEF